MLGFLSSQRDLVAKVKANEIFFVSCPNKLAKKDIKANFAPKAKLFAEKLNINQVFLHLGKVIIKYDYKV